MVDARVLSCVPSQCLASTATAFANERPSRQRYLERWIQLQFPVDELGEIACADVQPDMVAWVGGGCGLHCAAIQQRLHGWEDIRSGTAISEMEIMRRIMQGMYESRNTRNIHRAKEKDCVSARHTGMWLAKGTRRSRSGVKSSPAVCEELVSTKLSRRGSGVDPSCPAHSSSAQARAQLAGSSCGASVNNMHSSARVNRCLPRSVAYDFALYLLAAR